MTFEQWWKAEGIFAWDPEATLATEPQLRALAACAWVSARATPAAAPRDASPCGTCGEPVLPKVGRCANGCMPSAPRDASPSERDPNTGLRVFAAPVTPSAGPHDAAWHETHATFGVTTGPGTCRRVCANVDCENTCDGTHPGRHVCERHSRSGAPRDAEAALKQSLRISNEKAEALRGQVREAIRLLEMCADYINHLPDCPERELVTEACGCGYRLMDERLDAFIASTSTAPAGETTLSFDETLAQAKDALKRGVGTGALRDKP